MVVELVAPTWERQELDRMGPGAGDFAGHHKALAAAEVREEA